MEKLILRIKKSVLGLEKLRAFNELYELKGVYSTKCAKQKKEAISKVETTSFRVMY